MTHRQKCRIKIIVNPSIECGFAMYFAPDKPIMLKIFLSKISDIHAVIDSMHKTFPNAFCWNIEWNWTNVPHTIKNDLTIRKKILDIFAAKPSSLTDKYYCREYNDYTHPLEQSADHDDSINDRAQRVLDYISKYNLSPNIKADSIHDFIRFALNDITILRSESEAIAKRVDQLYVPPPPADNWGE
jgi:hypothetical protein